MTGLIVTADDFGAARQVNEAVERAHTQGILTAASLMVGGAALQDAVERARRLPSLRIGLHLVLVEGRPMLPPADIPHLVDGTGGFRRDMVASAVNMFWRPSARRQLSAEIAAQFEAFRATGLPLDHVNTHKHFHLHPTILGAILEVGRRHGLNAMRVPNEPRLVLARADAGARLKPAYVTAPWAELVKRRLARADVATADRVFGLQWSGAMTTGRLRGLIEALPEGVSEIYLHPATDGAFEDAVATYDYAGELAALTAPEVIAAVRSRDIALGGFSDLVARRGAKQAESFLVNQAGSAQPRAFPRRQTA